MGWAVIVLLAMLALLGSHNNDVYDNNTDNNRDTKNEHKITVKISVSIKWKVEKNKVYRLRNRK